MTTLIDPHVGRLFVPELDRSVFLPGRTTATRPAHQALVTYAVRTPDGRKTQAAYAAGVATFEGLRDKWRADDDLQRRYASPEAMLAAMQRKLASTARGYTHNERVANGAAMVSKSFWGSAASVNNGTVNPPTRIALCNLNGFAAAASDQSLGSGSGNVTTNEWTTNGLGRTGALTPGGLVAASTLDGQFTLTLANTYTCNTGASTVYGTSLVDNTSGAFNQYSEAAFTSATLQIADTLSVTWTVRD